MLHREMKGKDTIQEENGHHASDTRHSHTYICIPALSCSLCFQYTANLFICVVYLYSSTENFGKSYQKFPNVTKIMKITHAYIWSLLSVNFTLKYACLSAY